MALLLIIVPALVACSVGSNVKSIKFTKENKDQVLEAVKKSKDLTGEEVGLFTAAMVRYALSGDSLEGKTVGQVIAEQKKIRDDAEARAQEERRLAEEARKKEEALAAEIRKYLILTVYEKGFLARDIYAGRYEDYITFKVAAQNTGTRSIRGFRGTVIFKDLFGETIKEVNLSEDTGLGPGEKKNYEYTLKYNQFIDSDVKLQEKALSNMKVEWQPKTVLFTDGTKLGE